jgi:hypothetical protein
MKTFNLASAFAISLLILAVSGASSSHGAEAVRKLQIPKDALTRVAKRKVANVPIDPDCPIIAWQFARKQSKHDFARIFARVDRAVLEANMLNEVTQPANDGGEFPYSLLTYLIRTENDPDMRGFWEVVQFGADLKSETSKVRAIDPTELCGYYKKGVQFRNENLKDPKDVPVGN